MHEALLLAAALLSGVAGMGWLALAMSSHWEQVRSDGLSALAVVRLRTAGALMLLLSLLLCLSVDHASMAVLVWTMLLALSALVVALLLTWAPMWLLPLAILLAGRGRQQP